MSKNAEIEKAWDSFLASIEILTEADCITWARKEMNPRADIVIEVLEGEDLKEGWEVRVWNHDEEKEDDGKVDAYVLNSKVVQRLGPMLLNKVPH